MSFYRTAPDEHERDYSGPETVRCDRFDVCGAWIVDGAGDNIRVGEEYLCPSCGGQLLEVVAGREQAARSDESRDK